MIDIMESTISKFQEMEQSLNVNIRYDRNTKSITIVDEQGMPHRSRCRLNNGIYSITALSLFRSKRMDLIVLVLNIWEEIVEHRGAGVLCVITEKIKGNTFNNYKRITGIKDFSSWKNGNVFHLGKTHEIFYKNLKPGYMEWHVNLMNTLCTTGLCTEQIEKGKILVVKNEGMKHRCELTFNGTFSASLKTDYGTVVISSPAEILSVLNGYEDVSRALTKIQEENERIDEEERQMWV